MAVKPKSIDIVSANKAEMPSKITASLPKTTKVKSVCDSKCNMHAALLPMLVLGQVIGMLPLKGIFSIDVNDIRIDYKSFAFVYQLLSLFANVAMAILSVCQIFACGFEIETTGDWLEFILACLFVRIQFVNVTRKWGNIMREWYLVESTIFKNYSNLPKLKNRFTISIVIFVALSVVSHLLWIAANDRRARQCINYEKYPAEIYYGVAYNQIFRITAFSVWKAIFAEICDILAFYSLVYSDLLIILLSESLAQFFRQISESCLANTLNNDEKVWKQIREDYTKLYRLCLTVDNAISPLVFVSVFNNAFSICIQLYNSSNSRADTIENVFFYYRFAFHVTRILAISLYAAWIHEESKRPLDCLHSVTSQHYDGEVKRFIFQIHHCEIGFTGFRYFTITKGFILSLASTVVTFEIMLLQFGPLYMKQKGQGENDICIL